MLTVKPLIFGLFANSRKESVILSTNKNVLRIVCMKLGSISEKAKKANKI